MTQCQSCGCVTPLPYPAATEIAAYYQEKSAPSDWENQDDWETVHYIRLDWNSKHSKAQPRSLTS